MKLKGRWFITLYNGDQVKDYREGDNVIVTDGKSFLAQFLNSAAAAASTFTMRYIAIGTGTGAEAAADAALGTEAARATTGTVSAVSGAIYQVTATFASGVGTGAITEYGLFSTASATAGTMFSRDLEDVINKGANDTLTVTTQITVV
jgi:hypothetical protein